MNQENKKSREEKLTCSFNTLIGLLQTFWCMSLQYLKTHTVSQYTYFCNHFYHLGIYIFLNSLLQPNANGRTIITRTYLINQHDFLLFCCCNQCWNAAPTHNFAHTSNYLFPLNELLEVKFLWQEIDAPLCILPNSTILENDTISSVPVSEWFALFPLSLPHKYWLISIF